MANEEQLAILCQGVDAWNAWRARNLEAQVDLSEADLVGSNLGGANLGVARLAANVMTPGNFLRAGPDLIKANLREANLAGANLHGAKLMDANLQAAVLLRANLIKANLHEANLQKANLTEAKLFGAGLTRAYLSKADFTGADLTRANFVMASLGEASLAGANLTEAGFVGAYLTGTNLRGANLTSAVLLNAHLTRADLTSASLREADLTGAHLVETDFTDADLTGCRVYGISAWDLKLDGTNQNNLIIRPPRGEPEITVDNLEVAQFIYLLLNNERIRHVIDTITSKVVLILGRFTDERKAVLDALREELRQRDYTPVLFDFDKPASKDLTGRSRPSPIWRGSSSPISRTRAAFCTSWPWWSRLPWSPSSRSFWKDSVSTQCSWT